MRIVYLSYERGIELEDFTQPSGYRVRNQILHTDINEIEKEGLQSVVERIRAFKPNLIIEREFNDGKAIYTDLLKEFPDVKKAVWLIDTHVSLERHKEYARNFDSVFVAVSAYVEPLTGTVGHDRVYWLPLCYPLRTDSIHINYNDIKYPISFVGRFGKTHPERTIYLAALSERYGRDFLCLTDYGNMYPIIKRSKISFNHSINNDMNFRVWEILASGTEVLTDDVEDIHKVEGLEHRVHLYRTFDEAVDIIDRILSDDPRTTRNTIDNQKWVQKKHSLIHRHLAMLDMIRFGKQYDY